MQASNSSIKQMPESRLNTWVLAGRKAGDTTQMLALAEALKHPFTIKKLVYRSYELLSNRLLGATLHGINRPLSSTLEPPWPDLVISAGRRNEPVARWIQKQADKTVILVHIGRPWAPLDTYDLIISTPQYFLPAQNNVLNNQLPLHTVNTEVLAQAAARWQDKFSHLPRPYTAVLIGGDSGPFVYSAEKGQRLGRQVNELAENTGGSLLITDSARTPGAAFEAFQAELTLPAYIHRWSADAGDNPYLAYLALADQLVVTGDSMSMLAEAAATAKPLFLFDPGAEIKPWWHYPHNYRYKPLSHRIAMRAGPQRMRRDVRRIQRSLVASSRAVWLGEAFPHERLSSQPPDGDLQRAVTRVRALID